MELPSDESVIGPFKSVYACDQILSFQALVPFDL